MQMAVKQDLVVETLEHPVTGLVPMELQTLGEGVAVLTIRVQEMRGLGGLVFLYFQYKGGGEGWGVEVEKITPIYTYKYTLARTHALGGGGTPRVGYINISRYRKKTLSTRLHPCPVCRVESGGR